MTYIPKDRFIQICACAHPQAVQDSLFALDENGAVYQFNHEHGVWVPFPRDRGQIASAFFVQNGENAEAAQQGKGKEL